MAYLNKQQEVIKIQLTRLGKRLISKGNFKPSYYQFFDDDIVYDSQYAGFTEHQNAVQDRIKSGLTTEIQHTIIDIEEAHNIEMDKRKPPYFPVDSEYASDLVPANREAQLGTDAYFKELVQHNTVIEKEKLLQHPLSNMNVGARTLPRLNLTTFEAEINNSSSVEFLTQSGINTKIPQINFEPTYNLHRDTRDQIEEADFNFDFESPLPDFTKIKIEFLDKSYLELQPENVSIILEESSVPFTKENFQIEFFEILEEGTDNEVHLPINDDDRLFSIFNILVDDSVDNVPKTKQVNKNFFSN